VVRGAAELKETLVPNLVEPDQDVPLVNKQAKEIENVVPYLPEVVGCSGGEKCGRETAP